MMACPKIQSFRWGAIEVDGIEYPDVKIFPDQAVSWDWLESDTSEIRLKDVEDLLQHECTYIIVSRGINCCLDVGFDTYKLLLRHNVDFLITDTITAIWRYGEAIKEGHIVGALINTKD